MSSSLLQTEIDAIFTLQTSAPPTILHLDAVFAWSPAAHFLAVSPNLIDKYNQLEAEFSAQTFVNESAPNAAVRLCESLINSYVSGGPSYLVTSVPDLRPVLPIVTSSAGSSSNLTRPENWQRDEWLSLMNGDLGPWALAVAGNNPVCVCFFARRTPTAAEAGIWTRQDHRGKRLAAATVAAWANLERQHKEFVFYSTSKENLASRSVARQLGLSEAGWIWKIQPNKDISV